MTGFTSKNRGVPPKSPTEESPYLLPGDRLWQTEQSPYERVWRPLRRVAANARQFPAGLSKSDSRGSNPWRRAPRTPHE